MGSSDSQLDDIDNQLRSFDNPPLECQELLGPLQDIGKIGCWSIDLNTRQHKWTEGIFRVLGYSGEALKTVEEVAALFAPKYKALLTEAMHKAEELDVPIDVELRLARQATDVKDLLTRSRPAKQETCQRWVRIVGKCFGNGETRLLICTAQDITDNKELELIRDNTDTIIWNDLLDPLKAIINCPDSIRDDDNALSEWQKELLGYIEDSGRIIQRQVVFHLDMMNVECGKYSFVPSDIDLVRVIRDIISLLPSILKDKCILNITVNGGQATDVSTFQVHAEERLSFPMLCHIITNSIEASPAGECITISMSAGNDYLVSIRNVGSVPTNIRASFFNKYVTSGKANGTGLGTYSANLLAKVQGGSVELDTSEEGATTVNVRLPRS